MHALEIPLSPWADRAIGELANATGTRALAQIRGATLLGERAKLAGLNIPGRISAGGGCQLFDSRDDVIALNLSRRDDRELLPALFEDETLDPGDTAAISRRIADRDAGALVQRARSMGMAIAAEHEILATPFEPCVELVKGLAARSRTRARPRVVDLSALWAGPLASHLLALAGAEAIKVESRTRPDAMRDGDSAFFALLNQDKASVVLDFAATNDRRALVELLASADIVIEASRPRALAQLGIDAAQIVATTPGLVWITITAHGVRGDAAQHVGFGDDCGVAGGLSAALRAASGHTGFIGDAIADPLTGVYAALTAWNAWSSRRGGRFAIAMSHVVAQCLAQARERDTGRLNQSLVAWQAAVGKPFPDVQQRPVSALPALGEHTHSCLAKLA